VSAAAGGSRFYEDPLYPSLWDAFANGVRCRFEGRRNFGLVRDRRRTVDRRRAAGAYRDVDRGAARESSPRAEAAASLIRHRFDSLVLTQAGAVTPAGLGARPRHGGTARQTPVFDPSETRTMLDSLDLSTHAGQDFSWSSRFRASQRELWVATIPPKLPK